MNKAPVLSDEEIWQASQNACLLNEYKGLSRVEFSYAYFTAQAQNDADHKHYQGIIREIFEEIEAYCQSGQCWLKTESPFNWQSLKSRLLNNP